MSKRNKAWRRAQRHRLIEQRSNNVRSHVERHSETQLLSQPGRFAKSSGRPRWGSHSKRWKYLGSRSTKLRRAAAIGRQFPRYDQDWHEQMSALRVLFVCSRNQWRSPTAEKVWSRHPGLQVASVGTSPRARRTVTIGDVRWAELILVMEQKHADRLRAKFGQWAEQVSIVVLDIPDNYRYMDSDLVEILKERAGPHLPAWPG